MKKGIPVSIRLSVLLTLVLAGCADAAEVKLTPSDGAVWDCFGYSVSISGEYAIVGAHYDNDKGNNSGSAYIFKRDGTGWTEQAKVTASDGAAYDEFGRSIAISGDCAIVGAYYDDDNGSNSGSAYIFKRDNSSWSEQAKIIANDGAVDDHFGCSVAISGDYAIVGVHCDDDNGNESGSAYIYDILTPEPPTTGDLNGDDRLTSADAVIALWMAAGSCEPPDAADVSSDGVVNSLDALMILQAAAGLITL